MFNNLHINTFTKSVWNKKTTLFKSAIKIPSEAVKESDLYEMCEDEYFETRLVTEVNGLKKVKEGPFTKNYLDKIKGPWTIFVHNLNLYNDFSNQLEKMVEFIPKFIFDDVMCSLSTAQSSVGAHTDHYNVFILQVSGKREWQIQHNPVNEFSKDDEIKVLTSFTPDECYELNSGDMLFIPAGVAHAGVSKTDSISLSIGFKSIESQALLEGYLNQTLVESKSFENDIYALEIPKETSSKYFIEQKVIDDLYDKMLEVVGNKSYFTNWLLNYFSQTKKPLQPPEQDLNIDEFKQRLKSSSFYFDEFFQMVSKKENDLILGSLNGELLTFTPEEYKEFEIIYAKKHEEIKGSEILHISEILYLVFQQGGLFFKEDE